MIGAGTAQVFGSTTSVSDSIDRTNPSHPRSRIGPATSALPSRRPGICPQWPRSSSGHRSRLDHLAATERRQRRVRVSSSNVGHQAPLLAESVRCRRNTDLLGGLIYLNGPTIPSRQGNLPGRHTVVGSSWFFRRKPRRWPVGFVSGLAGGFRVSFGSALLLSVCSGGEQYDGECAGDQGWSE